MTEHSPRVLIAKPGLDGHDVGAKIVVRALLDAGFDVVYTGLKKTATEIAEIARDENVDVIGFSILSGSHLPFCQTFAGRRGEFGLADKPWLVGGNIPARDIEPLKRLGVSEVFPFGTPLEAIVDYLREVTS